MPKFNFVEEYIEKYGEEKVLEMGSEYLALLEGIENEIPITSLDAVAFHLCEFIECKDCPVSKYNFDFRVTENDQDCMLCSENLREWMIEQAQLICKERLEDYRRTKIYEPIESEQTSNTVFDRT